jgi:hypothetical protein
MELTQELFQKCRRISAAIQEFLLQTGMVNARSTDVYDFLVRKSLVEKDRHNGLHFRAFLRELKESNLLHLIKQCSFVENEKSVEWYFNPVSPTLKSENIDKKKAEKLHQPAMDKQSLEILLSSEEAYISALPVRNDILYSPQQLELKGYYPRAYEYWTNEEYEILKRVYCQCKNVDAVASLLKRQPHIVKDKIESLGLK